MSGISYSHDVDLQLHNRNPNSKCSQEVEEELPPFSQYFPSPSFYQNQLFFDTMAADQTQSQANLGPIWSEPLPRVDIINIKAAQEISLNTSSAGTHLHSEPGDHSSKMKKSTFSKSSTARKSGKKDRHSKINTAQGVRDRRMRLSLQIARQFFDLQDMLGFDKASKTIDWLFSKSKKAITQLNCSPNPVSEMINNETYENVSTGGEKSEQKRKVNVAASEGEGVTGLKTAEKSVTSKNTKCTAKELREKARARARERTREKMMIRYLEKSNCNLFGEAYHLAQLGPAEYLNLQLFELGQESMCNSNCQDNVWTSESSLHGQLANMALLGATASSSGSGSCSMYDYTEKCSDLFTGELDSFHNNIFYPGNWDITSEYSNPNSINFQENTGYHFQYSDHNQVDQ